MADTTAVRLERARLALDGLSVGDAFGAHFELRATNAGMAYRLKTRQMPGPPWPFTDDTNMALSLYASLRQHGGIDQVWTAASFAEHFDPLRGYGMGAMNLLNNMRGGLSWQRASQQLFGGQGSYGNGGAMRVAPVGAYFADDLEAAAEHARRSAEITHSHPEGIAGAIAVAVASGVAAQLRGETRPTRVEFIDRVLPYIPDSVVRGRTVRARDEFGDETPVDTLAYELGTGMRVSAQDTVPFVLWCAGRYLDHYEEALWFTLSGYGDTDTTCAMVGGIVACYTGPEAIPAEWLTYREALPDWAFAD